MDAMQATVRQASTPAVPGHSKSPGSARVSRADAVGDDNARETRALPGPALEACYTRPTSCADLSASAFIGGFISRLPQPCNRTHPGQSASSAYRESVCAWLNLRTGPNNRMASHRARTGRWCRKRPHQLCRGALSRSDSPCAVGIPGPRNTQPRPQSVCGRIRVSDA